MISQKKYCIIGAGPSGLTSAKNLKDLNIPFDVYERASDIGGNWWIENPHSAVCHSTHLISSKGMSHFKDYLFPDDYPDYPHHSQMCEYMRGYANKFGLYDHIQFDTSVERCERTDDGLWSVKLSSGDTHIYKGLILANGHLWDPKYPDFPGEFTGTTLHSKDYKTPEVIAGKRVVVVGAGNSGCDIAVEAAHHATAAYHSTRRGYYYAPKYFFGKPTDEFSELPHKLGVPLRMRQIMNALLLRFHWGNLQKLGLPKPDHKVLETHPIVNSQLIYHIRHGDIIPKPNIKKLNGDTIEFEDGSEVQADVLVYATGFNITFPFIDSAHLNWDDVGPKLYLHAFHREYDNLFVVGLLQPDGGIFHLMDGQAQLIARFIKAQDEKPEKAQEFHQIKATNQPDLRGGAKHINTPRHYLEIEHYSYFKRLKKLTAQLI